MTTDATYKEKIYPGDIDFLLEKIGGLTDSLHHESPSEFIERVRYIPKDLTPFPGKFSFEKFPYFREMVDCFSPESPIQEVALMKGNQMGATTAVLETILLYNIMCAPKAQMYVTADAGLMKTSVLVRNRTNAYTGSKRKIFWGSTPLVKQTSKIEGLYLAGDQRKFFVPCKHCGTMQELIWHGKNESGYVWGITWENSENFEPRQETVAYRCSNPGCGKTMKNYDKAVIIPKGEWRPTAKPANPSKRSYHITPIYNPPGMYSWEDMVLEWAECWDLKNNRMRDKENYRLFRNTKQGLTFEELGTRQIEYSRAILFRRTGFIIVNDESALIARGVPNDIAVRDKGSPILIVIASVDVQENCLFVDVKGYSYGGVTWTLEIRRDKGQHRRIQRRLGSTGRDARRQTICRDGQQGL